MQTPSKAKESGADSAAVETLALAISSFNHFDKDGNGSLAQVIALAHIRQPYSGEAINLTSIPVRCESPKTKSCFLSLLLICFLAFRKHQQASNHSCFGTQEEVTGTLGEVDNSAHAKRTKEPGQGEAGDISKRWQLMDLNQDGEIILHLLHPLCYAVHGKSCSCCSYRAFRLLLILCIQRTRMSQF